MRIIVVVVAAFLCAAPGGGKKAAPAQAVAPTFDLNIKDNGSGPSLVSNVLTINGTTMDVVADYDARKINGTSWTASAGVAGTLSVVGSGTAPVPEQPAPFTEPGARAVTYAGNSNKLHDGASTGIGTLDYAVEWVFTQDSTSAAEHYGLTDWDNTAVKGFLIGTGTSNSILKVYHADGTLVSVSGSTTLALGSWNDVMCFFKRTGNVRCYLNGASEIGGTVISARTASITNTVGLGIGGGADAAIAANTWPGKTALARVWTCNACLNTTAQMDTVAKQRFSQITGTYPVCAGACTPTSNFRATTANLDIDRDRNGVRRIFTVGIHWMPVVQHVVGTSETAGYAAEAAATSYLLRNDALDNAAWTKTNITATANTTVEPLGTTTADSLTSTSGAGSVVHFADQTVSWSTGTTALSSFVRWLNGGATYAFVRDTTVANAIGWIKLADCSPGTKGAGAIAIFAEKYGGGWCRVGISFAGTAATHSFDIGFSNADNVTAYDDGTNASAIAAWCTQLEVNEMPTSCILTTSATVTRNASRLTYDSVSNSASATGETDEITFTCPNYDTTTNGPGLFAVGQNGTNYTEIYIKSDEQVQFSSGVTSGTGANVASSSVDATDGAQHVVRIVAFKNTSKMYYDGVLQSTTTNANKLASANTEIDIGHLTITGAALQPNCVISRFRSWPAAVPP